MSSISAAKIGEALEGAKSLRLMFRGAEHLDAVVQVVAEAEQLVAESEARRVQAEQSCEELRQGFVLAQKEIEVKTQELEASAEIRELALRDQVIEAERVAQGQISMIADRVVQARGVQDTRIKGMELELETVASRQRVVLDQLTKAQAEAEEGARRQAEVRAQTFQADEAERKARIQGLAAEESGLQIRIDQAKDMLAKIQAQAQQILTGR